MSEEVRFLRGRADLDNQNRDKVIGRTAAPRLELCGRNGEGLGGAVVFAYLGDSHVDELGVRRRFKSALLDFDLLLWELRPLRLVRMNARIGVGINRLSYRREGGGDPSAAAVPTTNETGPLVGIGAGAASAALNTVSSIVFNDDAEDIDLSPTTTSNGTTATPRAKEVFARSFTGASIHVGLDETVVLGRSGFALFASGDARGVGGMYDSAIAVSARAGVKGFRRFGRYRVHLAAGYCIENWWLYQSGFDDAVGAHSMAAFTFHGPFGQVEFKF